MKSDQDDTVLARSFFFAGFAGLPFLWIANCFYFFPLIRKGVVNPDAQRCKGIVVLLKKYLEAILVVSVGMTFFFLVCHSGVRRSLCGSLIAVLGALTWLIYFQLRWRTWGSWVVDYMVTIPDADLSGW